MFFAPFIASLQRYQRAPPGHGLNRFDPASLHRLENDPNLPRGVLYDDHLRDVSYHPYDKLLHTLPSSEGADRPPQPDLAQLEDDARDGKLPKYYEDRTHRTSADEAYTVDPLASGGLGTY